MWPLAKINTPPRSAFVGSTCGSRWCTPALNSSPAQFSSEDPHSLDIQVRLNRNVNVKSVVQ